MFEQSCGRIECNKFGEIYEEQFFSLKIIAFYFTLVATQISRGTMVRRKAYDLLTFFFSPNKTFFFLSLTFYVVYVCRNLIV